MLYFSINVDFLERPDKGNVYGPVEAKKDKYGKNEKNLEKIKKAEVKSLFPF